MFGDNLREYRIKNGYSQSELAEKLFVTRQCISKWEKGVTQPDLETLERISGILGVSADELIKDGGAPRTEQKKRGASSVLIVVSMLAALFFVAATVVLWRFMPETVPAHFTNGTIDRYGSRNEILLHIISFAVFAAIDISVYFAVRRRAAGSGLCVVHGVMLFIQVGYFVFVMAIYAKYITAVTPFVTGLCLCLMLCLSVAMNPKIGKPNGFFGVRTSATLGSPEVWNKTNALACYLFGGVSLVLLIIDMVLAPSLSYLLLTAYAVPAAVVLIYSKIISKKSAEK